jgi:hypothetical protein
MRCDGQRSTFRTTQNLVLQEEIVAACLLLLIQLRSQLVDSRTVVGWVTTERDVERLQKGVHSTQEILRPTHDANQPTNHNVAIALVMVYDVWHRLCHACVVHTSGQWP